MAVRRRKTGIRTLKTLAVVSVATSLLLSIWSCPVTRDELDVQIPVGENPADGLAARIIRVTDERRFEVSPSDPATPSLMGDEIDDPSITKRAVARKRNGYGLAMGDILLPPGRTVETVVTEALTRALRGRGVRVLAEDDSDYSEGVPLEVDVLQFWAWFTPGFPVAELDFEARVVVRAPMGVMADGEEIRDSAHLRTSAARRSTWQRVIDLGLADLDWQLTDAAKRSLR